jgi:hypothetical protein
LYGENDRVSRPVQPFATLRILEGEAPTPPALLIDGLVIDHDVTVMSGHGGSAKSTVALHVALSVALDRPVFGTRAVRRPGAVLLVLPEDGEANARMILDALAADLSEEDRLAIAERVVMIRDGELVNLVCDARRLRRTAEAHGAVLVVLDPLRNLIGDGDENDNGVAAQVFDGLRREVCRGAGAAVLAIMHHRKPGKDVGPDAAASVHEMRGAGGWANAARLVFSVSKRQSRVTLAAVKANRLRQDLRHEVELTIVADATNAALWRTCRIADCNAGSASEALTPGVARELTANERSALEALDDRHEPGARSSWSAWVDASGVSANSLKGPKGIKSRLLDAGLVQAIKTGRENPNHSPQYVYAITDAGRALIHPDSDPDKGDRVREG